MRALISRSSLHYLFSFLCPMTLITLHLILELQDTLYLYSTVIFLILVLTSWYLKTYRKYGSISGWSTKPLFPFLLQLHWKPVSSQYLPGIMNTLGQTWYLAVYLGSIHDSTLLWHIRNHFLLNSTQFKEMSKAGFASQL